MRAFTKAWSSGLIMQLAHRELKFWKVSNLTKLKAEAQLFAVAPKTLAGSPSSGRKGRGSPCRGYGQACQQATKDVGSGGALQHHRGQHDSEHMKFCALG